MVIQERSIRRSLPLPRTFLSGAPGDGIAMDGLTQFREYGILLKKSASKTTRLGSGRFSSKPSKQRFEKRPAKGGSAHD